MLLAVDIGNTRIKAAVFEDDTLLEVVVFDAQELSKKIAIILARYPKTKSIIVASVGNVDLKTFPELDKNITVYVVSHESRFPFTNLYATPKTLGIDRLVLATGATLKYPGHNRLVIDAGTCITYDFVDEYDQYQGGAISPGIKMRYESLHRFTAKLPLLTKAYPEYVVGNSTEESIHSGIVNGVTLEIDGFINQYLAEYDKFIIILTGGDADFLAKRLKNTIFVNSNFLLESLNQTFQYNQK